MPSERKLKKANHAWMRPFEANGGARYIQISKQIIGAVHDGVLLPGDRLPPQRDLAQTFGVDLTTVTRALAEVRNAGLLDAHGAGGTFIATHNTKDDRTVDLSMNIPPLLHTSGFTHAFAQGMQSIPALLASSDLMSYHVGAGNKADREAAALWLKPMLGTIDSDRIVICPGTQSALAAWLLAYTEPEDTIVVDALTYPGMLAAARLMQRNILPVEADEHGMHPDALAQACKNHSPAMIYLIPTIHNPTTITLSQERREALLAVASQHHIPILEDDPYWLLAGDAPPPLATMQSARSAPVYYASTLSKYLAPGLRTSYLVVPHSHPIEPLLDALRSITLMAPQPLVALASQWIRSGIAQDLFEKAKNELAKRQTLARSILPEPLWAHPCGLHAWLALPNKVDLYRLIQTAQEQGLGVANAEAFTQVSPPPNGIRISLGGAPDMRRLQTALEKLAAILHDQQAPRPYQTIV
ncbi:PLP-dependent aminotransferase family protein [Lampropedia puyangensis]|uniref:PLP-dependent aminotransferase family protein n=1 Tax=Lampropedia puyangensis TaxID=1330072 RepID=A0A4S8ESL9_9BURK|nr:PLP-dependent aminotransferase family protein [Lampropedia puyangensis]THT97817.1 PLP-dependent aminotransferase family protein [Lampropedia puyangensis]